MAEYFSRGLNLIFDSYPSLFYDTKKGLRISHLAYANDVIIFCKGLKLGVRRVLDFLKHYEQVSGQKTSYEKSNIFVGKADSHAMLQNLTGFLLRELPFFYLGAPIYSYREKKDFSFRPSH